MGDSKVTSQLSNMVKFIEKEANEKAQEIRDKTQSEYTIEKAKIVIAQKEKITVEIIRKQQQVVVEKRIAHSREITKFRLEILRVREQGVRSVVTKATEKLNAYSHQPEYKNLLVRLILQAVAKLIDEAEITVRIRQEDLAVAKEALALAQQELQKYHKTNRLTLDTTNFLPPSKHSVEGLATCAGGVVLTAKHGKIVCDNTIDARLRYAFDDLVPTIRKVLFAEPDRVPTVMDEKEHVH